MSYIDENREIHSDLKVGDLVELKPGPSDADWILAALSGYGIVVDVRNAGRYVFKCEVLWQNTGKTETHNEEALSKVA